MDSLVINLTDIDESGKEFHFKMKDDGALDAQLSAVVEGLKDFHVQLKLTKTGDIYTAIGEFKLHKEDICSLCAEDMILNVNTKINEYLVIENTKEIGHAPHSGLNFENTQETYFLDSTEFDVFAFLREVMVAAVTLYPKCADTVACAKTQEVLKAKLDAVSLKGNPAFAVLEKLKKH